MNIFQEKKNNIFLPRKRMHGYGLGMDTNTQSAGRTSFQQDNSLPPQHRHQAIVQFDFLQFRYEPVLLFASLFLRIQPHRHDPLLSQADQGHFERQREVGFGAISRADDRYVLVAWPQVIVLFVHTD